MATSEGIPSSIDIEFLELNDNPYSSCILSFYFVSYTECVMCAVCPRYRLHKSNAMLKHYGGSPKWLEAQSLQGTLQQSFRRIER